MPKSDHSRWWLASEAVVALSLVAMPWCFGGAPPWTLWVLSGAAALALVMWTIGGARNHRRWAPHPALILPVVAVLCSALQLVPLPPSLLSVLSRPADELREFVLVPLGLAPWRPLSLDAPATARALARYVALGSFLFVTLELGRRAEVRRRLLALQVLVGCSIALTGLGHLLAGVESLFGNHQFTATLALQTPFGNTNHLAAYLALSATLGLALALSSDSRDAAIAWVAAAFTCGVAVFLSFSRGGIVTFVATWVLVGAALLAQRGGGIRAVVPWVVIGGTVLFAGLLAFEQLVARAETVATIDKLRRTKVELWPMLGDGLMNAWPLGLGAGAFENGFTRWQTQQLDVTFTHPENIWFQALSDWGLPLTLALLPFATWLVRRAWVAVYAMPLERTALLGLVGLLFHDVFDFALELQASGLAAAVTLGLVVAAGPRREARRNVGYAGPWLAAGVSGAGLAALAWGLPTHAVAETQLAQAIREQRATVEVRELAVAAIRRHPSDWVLFAAVAGDFARRADPQETLAWVNRLLFLRPGDARAHAAAGQALLRLKQPLQALGEFKLAWSLGDPTTLDLGIAVALRHDALDRLWLDERGHLARVWERLRAMGHAAEARALLDGAELAPVGDDVRLEAAVLQVRHESELGDPAVALAAWDALPEEQRQATPQQVVRVSLLERLGRGDEALVTMERLVSRERSSLALVLQLVDMLAARGRPTAGRQVLDRSRSFFVGADRATLFEREAALFIAEERWGRALEALETASRLQPTRADLHYRVATVYERLGSVHAALEAVRKGRLLDTPAGAKAQDATVARLESLLIAP